MVEVVGSRKLTAACSTVVWEGMEVITDSKKVYDAQTGVLDLILSDHKTNCLSCARNGSCELQALCRRFNRLHPELPDHLLRRAAAHRQPLHRPRSRQVRQVRPAA